MGGRWVSRSGTLLARVVGAAFLVSVVAPFTLAAPATQALVPPPAQRLFMVSDSVGLGAKTNVTQAFPGWQVTVTGQAGLFVEQLVTKYVQYAPASEFGDTAVVAAGYNYPYWDPPRFDRSVDLMVNTLLAKGVKHIYWVTMREVTPLYYPKWNTLTSAYKTLYLAYPHTNDQLRAAQLRHPELSLIDWAAVSDQSGLSYDAIHLNTTGATRYTAILKQAVLTGPTRQPAGTVTALKVTGVGGVADDAAAVALNLTVVNPRLNGFLTAYPCGGAIPTVSNLNFRANQIVASNAVVPVGADGQVCVFQSTEAHIVVDLEGAFTASSGFVALTPARALDTRDTGIAAAGSTTTVHLGTLPGAPTGAFTAVLNVTGIAGGLPTDVRVFTCGTPMPWSASRTIEAGRVQSLPMLVTTDANGDVCISTTATAHLLVDLFGAFPADADVHPLAATRLVDTRGGAMVPAMAPQAVQVSGAGAVPGDPVPAGAWITVSLGSPQNIGWAIVYPCADAVPVTSFLNVVPNHQQTGAGMVPLDATGKVCIETTVVTHLMVDVTGWTGSAFQAITPTRLIDTRNG